MFQLINGPQTLGATRVFWLPFIAVLAAVLLYPAFADGYDVGNMAYLLTWVFMAMGLCVVWGYGGMLSFGQTFFFGIAGYGYGVAAVNLGGDAGTTFLALAIALCLAAGAAAVLGYFMIWGRVGGVFFGIVTLSATLVLAFFLGQTAGPEWHIGSARLNGFNGMKDMAPLNIPWSGDDPLVFDGIALYYLVVALILVVYLGLRMMLNSRFGNVIVAVREDPQRAELLGYDVRKYQLATFVIGSTLAGLSGVLYTSWGQFITPASVGLPAAAMPIVWVAFSGPGRHHRHAGGFVPGALGLPDDHGLQPAGGAAADGRDAAVHGDGGAAGLRDRRGAGGAAAVRAPPSEGARGACRAHRVHHPRGGARMNALLETRALSKRFGGHAAVSEVDLSVRQGEIHCLIGPNGAGKSTLFKLIVGTHEASEGSIAFQGRDVTRERPFRRVQQGMSIKMQAPSVFKELPVRQNIHIALQHHTRLADLKREEDRLLELLDLAQDANKLAGELAHGQQQWLEIGMALALKPVLLLMDEPTAGLSPEETFKTGELIQKLNAEGMTVLVVEHDMAFIRQIAQRVTVLHFGKVFAEGSIGEIIADPRVAEIYLGKTHDH
jgi:urea transport system permease protein